MSAHRQVNIDMNFRANMNDVNSQINQLRTSLSNIITSNSFKSNLTPELRNATNAAKDLQIHLTKAMNPQTGQLDLSKFNLSLKQSNQSVQQLSQSLLQGGKQGQQAFTQLANSIVSAQAPMRTTNELMTRFMITLKNTARYQIGANMLMGFTKAVRDAFEYTKELNTNLNAIRVVTGDTVEEMDRFAIQANKVAKELGRGTNDIVKATLIYRQQGDTAEAAMKKAEITTKAANISFNSSAEEMSEYLTAIWNSYQVGEEQLESFVDKIAAVGAGTATSMEELATAMTKVAATANTVGVNFDQLTATISTVSSVTRTSAETVGTAFKTIYARMGDLKLGEALDDGVTLGTVSSTLEKVGIQILDTQGNMRDMGIVVEELGEKWQTMTSAQKQSIAQAVAGKRQYTQLMALFENWDMYKNAIELSENSLGTLQEQQDIYAQSWDAASKKVQASLESIYTKIFDDDMFIDMTNALATIITGLDNVIQGVGGFGNILLLTGSIAMTKFAKPIAMGFENMAQNLLINLGFAKDYDLEIRKQTSDVLGLASAQKSLSAEQRQQYVDLKMINDLNIEYYQNVNKMTEAEKLRYNQETQLLQQLMEIRDVQQQAAASGMNFATSSLMNLPGVVNMDEDGNVESRYNTWQTRTDDVVTERTDRALFSGLQNLSNDQLQVSGLTDMGTGKAFSGSMADFIQHTGQGKADLEELAQLTDKWKDKIQNVNNLTEEEKKDLEEAKKRMQELAQSTNITYTDDIGQLGKNAQSTLTKRTNKLSNQLTSGQGIVSGEYKGTKASKNIQMESRTAALDWLDQTQEVISANESYLDTQKKIENKQKEINDLISNAGAGVSKWATNLTTAASVLMGISSVMTSITNLGSIWKNEDLTLGEKIGQSISGVASAAMGLTMVLTSLKGTGALTYILNLGLGFKQGAAQLLTKLIPSLATTKVGLVATGGAASTAATGFGALWAAMWPIAAVAAGLTVAFVGLNYILTKDEKAQEKAIKKAEESKKAYEEQKQKVQELSSEIQAVDQKIAELKNKGPLSITDKADIANLETEKGLLEENLRIQQQIEAEKKRGAVEDNLGSYNTEGKASYIYAGHEGDFKEYSQKEMSQLKTEMLKYLEEYYPDSEGFEILNDNGVLATKFSREEREALAGVLDNTILYKKDLQNYTPKDYNENSFGEKYKFGGIVSQEAKDALDAMHSFKGSAEEFNKLQTEATSEILSAEQKFITETLNPALAIGKDVTTEEFDKAYKDLGIYWESVYLNDPEELFKIKVTPVLEDMEQDDWANLINNFSVPEEGITWDNLEDVFGSAYSMIQKMAREKGVSEYTIAKGIENAQNNVWQIDNQTDDIDVNKITKDQFLMIGMMSEETISNIKSQNDLTKALKEQEEQMKKNSVATNKFATDLDALKKKISPTNKAMKELTEDGDISVDIMSELETKYGGTQEGRNLLDQLWTTDSAEEKKKILNELLNLNGRMVASIEELRGKTKEENEALIAQKAALYESQGIKDAYAQATVDVGIAALEAAINEGEQEDALMKIAESYGIAAEAAIKYAQVLRLIKFLENNSMEQLAENEEMVGVLNSLGLNLGKYGASDGGHYEGTEFVTRYTFKEGSKDALIGDLGNLKTEFSKEVADNYESTGYTPEELAKKQKELNEKYAKDRLERLKDELKKRKELIEKYDSQIEVLEWAEELLDEQDYTGKLDVVNQKFETSKSKAEELINEYNRVKDIQATTGDEMTEVANRMEELGEEIRENISDMREYANQIYLTAAQSISTIVEGRTDAFDKLFSRIESRIQALKGESDTIGEGLLTANSEINMLAYLPVGATGLSEELEERKKEDKQLITQAKETEEEIADIKIKAMEKVAAEAAATRAEEIAGLNKVKTEVKKTAVTTKEDAKDVEDYVAETTVPNIQKELKKIGNTEIPTTGIDNFCEKVKEKITELVKAVSGELESDIFLTTISDNLNTKLDSIVAMLKEAGYGVPMGESVDMTAFSAGSGHSITQGARLFLGTPYKWGGTTNKGLDCSGLTWRVLRANGIPVDRTAAAQYSQNLGKAVSTGTMDLSQLQPGDSVFFKNTGGRTGITHVGIYIGNGKMIHAPSPGKTVQEQNLDTNYYREHWAGAKRYVNQYFDGGILPDETASIYGEEGFEYAVLPNGRIKKIGKDGIGIGNFPPGTKIIPHEAAKDLIKNWGELDNTFVKQYAKGTGSTVSPNLDETNENLEDIKKNTAETAENTKDNKDKDIINILKDKIPGFKEAYDITNQTEEHIKAQDAKINEYLKNNDVYSSDGQTALARFIAKTEMETAFSIKDSGDQILNEYIKAVQNGEMTFDSATFKELQEVAQAADEYIANAEELLSKSYEMSFSQFQIEANKQNEDIEYHSKFQNWKEGDSANVRINKLVEQMNADKAIFQADLDELLAKGQIDQETYDNQMKTFVDKYMGEINKVLETSWAHSQEYIEKYKFDASKLTAANALAFFDRQDKELETAWDGLEKTAEYYAAKNEIAESREQYIKDLLKQSKTQFFEDWQKEIDATKRLHTERIALLTAENNLYTQRYELDNKIREAQKTINKELKASMAMSAYLDEDTRKLLFNEEKYNTLSQKLLDIKNESYALDSQHRRDMQAIMNDENLSAEAKKARLEQITEEYNHQYSLLMKSYEIAQKELTVEEKRQALQNTLNNKNQMMFINGKWTNVADMEAVEKAQSDLIDAEYDVETAERDYAQTNLLRTNTRSITAMNTDDTVASAQLAEQQREWEEMLDLLEPRVQDFDTLMKDILSSGEGISQLFTSDKWKGFFGALGVSSANVSKVAPEPEYITVSAEEMRQKNPELFSQMYGIEGEGTIEGTVTVEKVSDLLEDLTPLTANSDEIKSTVDQINSSTDEKLNAVNVQLTENGKISEKLAGFGEGLIKASEDILAKLSDQRPHVTIQSVDIDYETAESDSFLNVVESVAPITGG